MKKSKLFLIILLAVLVGLYIWLVVYCAENSKDLFSVTIIDLINIIIDIIIGGVLGFILYVFTNKNSDLNSRKAIANETLNKLKSLLDEIKSPKDYSSFTASWNNVLIIKSTIDLNIRLLKQLSNMGQPFVDSIETCSNHLDLYFNFYETTFYEKALPLDSDFDKERLLIQRIKFSVIDSISKLY